MFDFKPYDILLYKGDGFLSRLIQWGTQSPYNHVAVVVDPHLALGIESNTGRQAGVRAIDLRSIESNVDVFRIRSEHAFDPNQVASFLVRRLGARFDFVGVSWLGFLKFLHVVSFGTIKIFSRYQRDKDYFCSELCYAAFRQGGLDIVPQVPEADMTAPSDIAKSDVVEKVHAIIPKHLSV